MGTESIGLYIHIPFCKHKCYYCDFNSYAQKEQIIPAYVNAVKKEIEKYSTATANYKIKTVFIGGGTPSYINSRYITDILSFCRSNLDFDPGAEISIEANPGTLDTEKLQDFKAAGINRISIGLQSCNDISLKKLGRIHDYGQFLESYNKSREVGFSNINVDLIFGMPWQSQKEWEETLEEVIRLHPEHISCYSLNIEEDTVFGDMLKKGTLIPLEDEKDRQMYHYAVQKLKENGYNHYEISNFAREGYECRHNLVYWKTEMYIGIGAGSHSYFSGKRYNNICNVEDYINRLSTNRDVVENIEDIGREESISEYIILGLRLTKGISFREFKSRFGEDLYVLFKNKIDSLVNRGLLIIENEGIKLTPSGLDLANQVFVEFI